MGVLYANKCCFRMVNVLGADRLSHISWIKYAQLSPYRFGQEPSNGRYASSLEVVCVRVSFKNYLVSSFCVRQYRHEVGLGAAGNQ